MNKHLYIILGNGFSIDLLHHTKKAADIDVRNLFRYGSCVRWPVDNEPGFLSFKHCPNLWNLGARPTMSDEAAMALIEDIITCVNVFVSAPKKSTRPKTGNQPNDIYIFAYKELSLYLKHLFVYYDKKFGPIPDEVNKWSWLRLIEQANSETKYSKITIVTYNYDIWLERILEKSKIPFNIGLIGPSDPTTKITILKPHGSIGFTHKVIRDRAAFQIALNHDLLDGDVADFSPGYDNLDANHLISALIPPAGESGRFNHTWAGKIRTEAKRIASTLGPDDDIIVCGLSYWHVDRAELDELLVNFDSNANIKMINPNPQRSLNAVITSIFKNYIAHNSASTLDDSPP
ncbi:hypothetical protein [Corallococcus carmarthensis]|uniref:hypothetical protein n=1 Tax=Corallococcus carmarthensis TaxID=2316728 RepID=UPI00148B451E|nr:hypothetical protein [Corallococcus carmarthensis]NOK18829.1 hypothetical protein [Corallococcus carmarthensis]